MRTPHSNSPVSGTPLNPETEAQLSLPGILGVKQTQQAAGIEQNKQATAYFRADIRRAHWLGAGVTVLAMIGALAALRMGSQTVAGLFLSVTVISVARALVESIRPSHPRADRTK